MEWSTKTPRAIAPRDVNAWHLYDRTPKRVLFDLVVELTRERVAREVETDEAENLRLAMEHVRRRAAELR